MRREGNIIQEIVEYNNIAAAFDHVVRGKRQEYEEGKELLAKREEVIAQLQHEIATGTFTVEEYDEVEINEYGKECACGNQKVGYENCGSDFKGGVLLQNHGDYVRSAAGSVHIEKNCGSYARHAHGEDKFEHRLTCHRLGYGN